jgi:hypothetical protein
MQKPYSIRSDSKFPAVISHFFFLFLLRSFFKSAPVILSRGGANAAILRCFAEYFDFGITFCSSYRLCSAQIAF